MALVLSNKPVIVVTGLADAQFQALLAHLISTERKVDQILMDEQLVSDKLDQIDAATTKAASNIQILADTDQHISDEFDALVQELKAAQSAGSGVSQALVDKATALGTKSQSVSDSLDAMVPALQAIASKGIQNPVPVPIPPAPPAVPPTPGA